MPGRKVFSDHCNVFHATDVFSYFDSRGVWQKKRDRLDMPAKA